MVLSFAVILARISNDTSGGPEDASCLSVDSVIRKRRHYDLAFSSTGFVFSTLHLVVLLYIRCVKRRKGFELLFTQASLSFLSLLFLVIGCLFDLCVFAPSPALLFFRAHIWLFVVNSLIAAYSFLIVVLCIDRYVALTRPLYYRVHFVRYRTRLGMILGSFVLAVICAVKWLLFNRMQDNNVKENEYITANWAYVLFRTASVVFQYFVCGVVMVLLSICNVLRLKELSRAHANELRMSERARSTWRTNHRTIAKICSFLAISFVLFNWPYSLVDYFYADEINVVPWFAVLSLVMNLCQVLFIQLNLFFFAFCSRSYRKILFHIFGIPFLRVRALMPCCHPSGKVHITPASAQKPKMLPKESTSTIVSLP
ncbi:hypothetical protein QR680_013352 [Steinernema hermaphroditum]|uniref:G-protein coupled receptors family 1 profile domain-containing protein n=1 Tax=Steinernema hermaphroditum TaxID=289476 RepID=A0AA39I809_9BILA|nr:hypothetical protein QR680_013352 [Steinernema hermaphroditum]